MPIRQLNFNEFKNITGESMLSDSELNLLATIIEKDISIEYLEALTFIYCVAKLSENDDMFDIYDIDYSIMINLSGICNYEIVNIFKLIRNKIQKKHITYLLSENLLLYYSNDTIVDKRTYKITTLGKDIVYKFLESEKQTPLLKQLMIMVSDYNKY